jgi:virginiamycin A acetyltransferase
MSDVVEGILRLDVAGEHDKIIDYIVRERRDPTQLVYVVYQLLLRNSYRGAFIVARALRAAGDVNPVVALAEGIGGALFGDVAAEADGRTTLQAVMDGLSADKQSTIYNDIIGKSIPQLIYHFFTQGDYTTVVKLMEIIKAGIPALRPIFDLSQDLPPLDIDAYRRQGRDRAKLIPFPGPPKDAPKKKRRAVVAIRHYFLLVNPDNSRLCDMGPRAVEAMNRYGWDAVYYGMKFLNPYQDYLEIAEACRQHNAEVLIIDDNVIQIEQVRPWRMNMLQQLRRDLPDIKIVSAYFDPWMLQSIDIMDASTAVDLVWTASPSLPLWRHPEFADKVYMAPMPPGLDFNPTLNPLRHQMTFAGGVMGYNWHRALWLGSSTFKGLPVEQQLSTHKPDGLPVLESYANYMQRLADATWSLNFSMRADLSRILTGRVFETTLSGALLVEEWSPEIDHYFVAGEHFFSFTSFAELTAITRFIESNPDEAEAIRRRGFDFARETYGDRPVIAGLEYALYHRERRPPLIPPISATSTSVFRLPFGQKQSDQGVMRMPADITHAPLPTVMQYMQDGVPVITIGRYSYINKMSTMTVDSRSRIVIGNFTSIAWDVLFLLRSNHHAEWATTYPVDWFPWDDSIPKPNDPHGKNKDNVTVGSDVWIGKGVTVMPGVTIGDGAIIAADAVVTKDVRPYAVIAGNPGREVKRRFDEETVAYLMDVRWWDMPNEFIMKHANIICSGDFEKLREVLPPTATRGVPAAV